MFITILSKITKYQKKYIYFQINIYKTSKLNKIIKIIL